MSDNISGRNLHSDNIIDDENGILAHDFEMEKGFIEKTLSDPMPFFTAILTFATIVLAVTTVILAILAIIQLGYLRRADGLAARSAKAAEVSSKIAADTLVRTQRPWVLAESATLPEGVKYRDQLIALHVSLTLKNTGPSLATGVQLTFQLYTESSGFPATWKNVDDALAGETEMNNTLGRPVGYVMAPNQSIPLNFSFSGPGDGQVTNIDIEKGTFFLAGLVKYKDQYGEKHFTRFTFKPFRHLADEKWDGKTLVFLDQLQDAD